MKQSNGLGRTLNLLQAPRKMLKTASDRPTGGAKTEVCVVCRVHEHSEAERRWRQFIRKTG